MYRILLAMAAGVFAVFATGSPTLWGGVITAALLCLTLPESEKE